MNNTRDMVILRLINFSVHILESQGVKKMFLDGARGGEEGFQSVGELHTWRRTRWFQGHFAMLTLTTWVQDSRNGPATKKCGGKSDLYPAMPTGGNEFTHNV